MDVDVVSWLSLAIRWLHLITGIAWIGSSFYFIWLDNSLKKPTSREDLDMGVGGELWAVHGGGFYHKKKYQVAPDHMPDDLHWFKWEAYFTWISGFMLLAVIYYYGASLFLIDPAKMALLPWQAIGISLAFMVGGWIFYDLLCKSRIGENNKLFGLIWFMALTLAAYGLSQIFTDRAAYIHVGVIIGTVMAANVFMVIIPNQKKTVASLLKGEEADPSLGIKAKQRSLHNNYMTLPVLLIMVSNHYPILFGHDYGWLILAGLGIAACLIRHFFNLKHKGEINYLYPAAGVAAFIAVMLMASYSGKVVTGAAEDIAVTDIRIMINRHCVACHSDVPTHEAFAEAPLGVMFDKMDEVIRYRTKIIEQAVKSDIMPLGNETTMTEDDRIKLGMWLSQQ
ncbi:MAG: hypothetical protein COB49_06060 [Alphaproteobacteria bacterium]|nr:MAG: hypothetical protein COB49_06060 [Alphaproteobacteria bacterium]